MLFVRRQLRLPAPLIDVRLFANRAFSGVVAANLLSVLGLSGLVFFLSQYFQLVHGYGPLKAGLAELPAAVTATVFGILAGIAVRYWSPRAVLTSGLALVGVAMASLTLLTPSTPYLPLGVALFLVGVGLGLAFTVASDVILASVPKERAGSAAAVSETAYELGMALGIATLGSIVTGVYRNFVVPQGIPADVAAHARDSLAAAIDAARHSARRSSRKPCLMPRRRRSPAACHRVRRRFGADADLGGGGVAAAAARAYQARPRSPCWTIQVCMAMPAATAALMLRVEPNWAIDTVNSAPALASVGDAGALLAEDQQAVPRQRGVFEARRAGHVVDGDDRQARVRGEGQQFGGGVVVAQPLVAVGHHGAAPVPAAPADDVHGVDGERVGGAHHRADVGVVAEVLDRDVQRVPALVDVGDDRLARPVAVCVNDVAGVAVAQQAGS